jgi:hypothetical protein
MIFEELKKLAYLIVKLGTIRPQGLANDQPLWNIILTKPINYSS